MRLQWTILPSFAAMAVLMAGIAGCDKDSNPAGSQQMEITETNLFPFAADRKLVYNEYALDATTGQKTPGSDHRHTIHVAGTVTWMGKPAYVLVDSTYQTGGTVQSVDTTYAAVENGNLYLDLGGVWGLLFNRTRGTETEYSVGSYVDTSLGFPISVSVSAIVRNKSSVTTPGGTFDAYKLESVGVINIGGQTLRFPQTYYFSDGVGIVKATTPPTADPISGMMQPGDEMVYVSRSF